MGEDVRRGDSTGLQDVLTDGQVASQVAVDIEEPRPECHDQQEDGHEQHILEARHQEGPDPARPIR